MRWDALFADLEAQLEEAERAELDTEVADRTREQLGRIRLVDRLRAARGSRVACAVIGTGSVTGALVEVGPDWLLLEEDGGREALVPLRALLGVSGLGRRSAAPGSEGAVAARLGLGSVLRGIARDRSGVVLGLVEETALHGTVDGVGADFVELASHGPGEARRAGDVRGARTVPLASVAVLRRSP